MNTCKHGRIVRKDMLGNEVGCDFCNDDLWEPWR